MKSKRSLNKKSFEKKGRVSMKKIISMVLCMVMVLSFAIPVCVMADTVSPHFEYEAQMLYNLGLFKGTKYF